MSTSGLCSLPFFKRKSRLGFCTRLSTTAALGPIVHHIFNNSAAVANPQLIRELSQKFGRQCIVIAIDAKQKRIDDESATSPPANDKNKDSEPGWEVVIKSGRERVVVEEVMDYSTYCCAIAALVQKPSRDHFPLKQGREQSPEIDIPSW